MKLQNRSWYILISCLGFINSTSCKKFVEVEPGSNLVRTSDVFTSESQALSAVNGVYSQLRSANFALLNGGLSLYTGLYSDELFASAPTAITDPFYQNQLLPSNSTINTYFYSHCYKAIYQANAVLEGVEASEFLSSSIKQQFRGEMKFVRGLLYFYLVNLFGDVPLILSTDYRTNSTSPRTAIATVYGQIVNDLIDSKNSLLVSYPSQGKARPNKWVATSLLGRVYLYLQDWQKAETETSLVINSGIYSLISSANISNIFLKENSETIWEIASPSEMSVPGEAGFFIPASSTVKPTYAIAPNLINAFEAGDLRKSNWVGKNMVSGTDYFYPRKYKQRNLASGGLPTEYAVVFRLSEQFLIRAEARGRLMNIAGAQNDLNMVRARAGLAATPANSQDSLLLVIESENRVEFFCEQGHRWFDLKRLNKATSVLQPIKGANWQSTDQLWPIPENQLTYNPSLVQNPGY